MPETFRPMLPHLRSGEGLTFEEVGGKTSSPSPYGDLSSYAPQGMLPRVCSPGYAAQAMLPQGMLPGASKRRQS